MKSPVYHVYILVCADTTLYIGSTNNIEKRIVQHNTSKAGARYTKIRRPVRLVYSEECATYADVRRREGELKRLSRPQKLALIAKIS